MGNEPVIVEKRAPLYRIRMNRPEKLNAQNPTLIDAVDAAFEAAAADPDVRVVVLSGQGRGFSAGHDLEYPGFDRRGYTYRTRLEMERRLFLDKMLRIRNLPKPTIAQVHGHCVAAGLMLACMCDLIVCDETTRFSNPVLQMALAGVQLLVEPWEVGARKAKELLWTAQVLTGEQARDLGLVNRVAPSDRLEEEVTQLALTIAALPSFAVQTTKKTINDTLDFMGRGAPGSTTSSFTSRISAARSTSSGGRR